MIFCLTTFHSSCLQLTSASRSCVEPVDDAVVIGSDASSVDDHAIARYTAVDDVDVKVLTVPHDLASRSISHKSCCSLL